MTALVTAESLVFLRGSQRAVDGVSFQLHAGTLTALAGTNGAGKTTLLKLILGLLCPASGTLSVLGGRPGENRRRVGYLPENVSFYDAMTIEEHLTFFGRLKGVAPDAVRRTAERLRLAELAKKTPKDCSKGQRQRLGLAQALLADPDVLLMDEPTTGLDPQTTQALYEILAERASQGCAVLISTHELALVEKHLDQVMMLKDGRLTAGPATLEALRQRAQLPVRVSVPGCGADWAAKIGLPGVTWVKDHFVLSETALVPLVKQLTAAGCFDFEVTKPDLTALYSHFNGVAV